MATHGVNALLFSATGESAVVNPTVVTIKPRSTTKPPKRTRARKNGDAARWYPLLDSLRKIAATRGPCAVTFGVSRRYVRPNCLRRSALRAAVRRCTG